MLFKEAKEVLGTWVEISLLAEDKSIAEAALTDSFAELKRIENKLSRFIEFNDLDRLNQNLESWQDIDEEFVYLFERAELLYGDTSAVFNLGVKEILESWGYDRYYTLQENTNSKKEDDKLLAKSFELDAAKQKVKLTRQVEFGGLGKGYALDRVVDILGEFSGVFINAGGDLYARGLDEKGEQWKAYFAHPLNHDEVIGEVLVDDLYLASSSANRRAWRDRHHLVDPKTKKPAADMLAVYTQADNGLLADAYATALYVMGFERAREFLEQNRVIEAMLISPRMEIWRTSKFLGELYIS